VSFAQECKRDQDEKAARVEELEEKVALLEKDTRVMLQERMDMKEESRVMKEEHQETQRQLIKIREEHLKLQHQFSRQQQEKVEFQKKVTHLETTLFLENQLEQKLTAARQEANFIMQMDKEVLIRKNLEELYGGKPKGFKVFFNSMKMFVDQVHKAEARLQKK
jgi:chromosome segregation ATPase